ncbi:hypothetical protein ACFY3U_03835 [Micromonospora sp. NPDC000089]|uniref:hypothetical protein n=1 Tax=unclassified Micromonospora TaxID=2617518 RepID=UPI003695C04B
MTATPPAEDPVIALRRPEVLQEGVPDHIDGPLRDWLARQLTTGDGNFDERTAQLVCLEAELLPHGKWYEKGRYHYGVRFAPQEKVLRAVNAYLKVTKDRRVSFDLAGLEQILTRGGSAYRVDVEGRCLVRRVDPSAQALKDLAVTNADLTASALLQQAWEACYGLAPSPDATYGLVVKAVEQVICPLVSPANPQPTLFKSRDTLLKDSSAWEMAVPDPKPRKTGDPTPPTSAERIIALVDLLCSGHISRHSGSPDFRAQTQEEAETALTLGITIVQLVTARSFRRR